VADRADVNQCEKKIKTLNQLEAEIFKICPIIFFIIYLILDRAHLYGVLLRAM